MTVLPEVRNLLFPLPVTLATCRARDGDAASDNIIPLSWVGIVEAGPHLVNACIGRGKYSDRVIGDRKEFGLCIAPVELMEAVDRCGWTHGGRTDKFALTGLTRTAATRIDVSLIAECPVCLECRVKQVVELDAHRMYIAEVLCTHVQERHLDANGAPDPGRMNVLCYVDGEYWSSGSRLQELYYTRKKP
jgi:flavin reductase (DIM6/NTAB) family NADH-FMN oxidoreductase RutF